MEEELVRSELSFLGIPADVAHAVAQVLGVTNEAVKVVFHPEGSGLSGGAMDLPSGMTLPGVNELFELPLGVQGEEGVNVIGHDHEADQGDAVGVEVMQGCCDGLGVLGVAQQATAMTGVEPGVQAGGELPMVFGLSLLAPRLGMLLAPLVALLKVGVEEGLWERVC